MEHILKPEPDDRCTILIASNDANKDLWKPFFDLLKKGWEDCQYKIVLATPKEKFEHTVKVKVFDIPGNNTNWPWGKRVREVVKRIDSEYILMMLDDFFICDYVDQQKFGEYLNVMDEDKSISVVHLWHNDVSSILNFKYQAYPHFEIVHKDKPYRITCGVPCIWRREELLKYLGNYDTPWTFDGYGTLKPYFSRNKFCCVSSSEVSHLPIKFKHVIEVGRWHLEEIKPLIESKDIYIDVCKRGVFSEEFRRHNFTKTQRIQQWFKGVRTMGIYTPLIVWRKINQCKKHT